MDTVLLKKCGPWALSCVKRHENGVQHEHWLNIYEFSAVYNVWYVNVYTIRNVSAADLHVETRFFLVPKH